MTPTVSGRLGALTAIVLLLGGCTAFPGQPYTELSHAQEPDDLVPYGTPDNIDPDSTRFVGSHDDADFYLGMSTDRIPCIIMDGVGGGNGCGGGELTVSWAGFGSARYLPPAGAGLEVPDGWTRVSDNLIVKPGR